MISCSNFPGNFPGNPTIFDFPQEIYRENLKMSSMFTISYILEPVNRNPTQRVKYNFIYTNPGLIYRNSGFSPNSERRLLNGNPELGLSSDKVLRISIV